MAGDRNYMRLDSGRASGRPCEDHPHGVGRVGIREREDHAGSGAEGRTAMPDQISDSDGAWSVFPGF